MKYRSVDAVIDELFSSDLSNNPQKIDTAANEIVSDVMKNKYNPDDIYDLVTRCFESEDKNIGLTLLRAVYNLAEASETLGNSSSFLIFSIKRLAKQIEQDQDDNKSDRSSEKSVTVTSTSQTMFANEIPTKNHIDLNSEIAEKMLKLDLLGFLEDGLRGDNDYYPNSTFSAFLGEATISSISIDLLYIYNLASKASNKTGISKKKSEFLKNIALRIQQEVRQDNPDLATLGESIQEMCQCEQATIDKTTWTSRTTDTRKTITQISEYIAEVTPVQMKQSTLK